MFRKILIANRGEIACRVIATAQRLGIRTVAVYSDADAEARHVDMADEAVHIGPAAAAESYLDGARVIAAARTTSAEAIHPGYGFLSENPEFVEAVAAAGLTFIGPPASAIRAMGLKDAAKALMSEAGVPVVPGYHGVAQDIETLAAEAEQIGYPVLIKARAGGGGKGMRLVERPGDLAGALEGAQREARASFGDPVCLIEKFITNPRHVEIQIFGDTQGNVVHLFERDCSLQRRHQKVIEEAPAPDMPEQVRDAMGAAAVEAAMAIGYIGAGTVEFIADGSGPLRCDGFWFMEMNTRLQVEHPVSEAITGLDFVELQLRIAAGAPLPFGQEDLTIDGWSFEARVYAEDVPKGFLPATGVLEHLSFPVASEFRTGRVRVDSGVRQGDAISPWYDPMIAKVIVHGPDRTIALNMLTQALADCHICGAVTNVEFLGALSRHAGFARGEVETGLIARDLDALTHPAAPPDVATGLAALSALGVLEDPRGHTPWDRLAHWRHWSEATYLVTLGFGDAQHDVRINALGRDTYRITTEDRETEVCIALKDAKRVDVTTAAGRQGMTIIRHGHTVSVFASGRTFTFDVPDLLAGADVAEAGGHIIAAPMPGLVKRVSAQAGNTVLKGDPLVVLEAMKMEHTLTAPRDGAIAEVCVGEGDQVADGTLLIMLEADDG